MWNPMLSLSNVIGHIFLKILCAGVLSSGTKCRNLAEVKLYMCSSFVFASFVVNWPLHWLLFSLWANTNFLSWFLFSFWANINFLSWFSFSLNKKKIIKNELLMYVFASFVINWQTRIVSYWPWLLFFPWFNWLSEKMPVFFHGSVFHSTRKR